MPLCCFFDNCLIVLLQQSYVILGMGWGNEGVI
jgi:hypothetical protein